MKRVVAGLLTIGMLNACNAYASEQIRIVGSSTVFPFVAAAAEHYSDNTGNKAPIVESIGSGAGILEFCKGTGDDTPDIVNSSRKMKQSEIEMCEGNGVNEVTEIPLGMDGIIIAGSKKQPHFPLTRDILFKALAKQIPVNGVLADNHYTRWKQIDESLPDEKIEVYGPKSSSGTRDAFVEMVMEPVCENLPEFVQVYADETNRKMACHMLREDGHYIEAGENDNLIVQKLELNQQALGIFGYSYLDQNSAKIMAHPVDGVEAEYDNIADGSYPVARSLYVYVKDAHLDTVKGMREFLEELTSEDALAEDGYLADKGLIAYPEAKLREIRAKVSKL